MRRASPIIGILLLLSALPGCSGEISAPEPTIFGYWSANGVSFAVSASSATLDFGCGQFESPGPLVLAEDGSFAFDALAADGNTTTPVHTEGRFLGSVAEVGWTYTSYEGDIALGSPFLRLQALLRVDHPVPLNVECAFPVRP